MTETPQPPEPSKPAAGYYPDNAGVQRYWDGNAWTERTQHPAAATPPGQDGGGPSGASRPWFKKKRFVIPGVLVALIVIGNVASGSEDGGSEGDPPSAASTPLSDEAAEEVTVDEPEATPTTQAAPKPQVPDLTGAQDNAVRAAESYLDYTAFSRKGLIAQLKFDDYSKKDATFAVDYIKPDYKQQAARAAAAYLDYSPFSRQGLIDQLKYDGYTQAQAEYGVSKTDL